MSASPVTMDVSTVDNFNAVLSFIKQNSIESNQIKKKQNSNIEALNSAKIDFRAIKEIDNAIIVYNNILKYFQEAPHPIDRLDKIAYIHAYEKAYNIIMKDSIS